MAANFPAKTILNTPPSVPQTNLQKGLQPLPQQAAPQGLPQGMSEVWNLYFQGKHQEVLQASA
jgi:hypothetical protein